MMQDYSAIEDAKPQRVGKTPTKKNLRISEMFGFLGRLNFFQDASSRITIFKMQPWKKGVTCVI